MAGAAPRHLDGCVGGHGEEARPAGGGRVRQRRRPQRGVPVLRLDRLPAGAGGRAANGVAVHAPQAGERVVRGEQEAPRPPAAPRTGDPCGSGRHRRRRPTGPGAGSTRSTSWLSRRTSPPPSTPGRRPGSSSRRSPRRRGAASSSGWPPPRPRRPESGASWRRRGWPSRTCAPTSGPAADLSRRLAGRDRGHSSRPWRSAHRLPEPAAWSGGASYGHGYGGRLRQAQAFGPER